MEFQVEEWFYLDGEHNQERISVLIVEKGIHRLANGQSLEVQTVTASDDSTRVTLESHFQYYPPVYSQMQTKNGADAATVHILHDKWNRLSVHVAEEYGTHDPRHNNQVLGVLAYGM